MTGGGMGDEERALLTRRDAEATAALARSRQNAGEIERQPVRGMTERAQQRQSLWTRIREECDS